MSLLRVVLQCSRYGQNNMKTFSIIIPTYNEEDHLGALLQDIREQHLQPKEIIVADACSTDATREIALSYGAQVVDGGLPGPGRNAGARASSSDVFFFMDSDVRIFDKDFLEKVLTEFVERELGCAATELEPMSTRADDQLGHWVYNRLLRRAERKTPYAAGSLIIATRQTHEAIHGFDEVVTLGEDSDYAARAAKADSFGILRSVKIPVSVRRLDRDGRWCTVARYMLAGVHMWFIGPVKNHAIKYEFGYDHMKKGGSSKS